MRIDRLIALGIACAAVGCGGTTIASGDGGSDATAGDGASSDGTSKPDGCPAIPSTYVYECDAGVVDAAGCGPYDHPATPPTYPQGCRVLLPKAGGFCGEPSCCGPQDCYCQPDPRNAAAFR